MFWKFKERAEWLACVDDLLPHRAVQQMTGLPQHRAGFSCGHRSLLVSYTSFCLCRRLGWNAREAARGGLLHDLYLYDWTDRGLHGAWDHLRNHPGQALRKIILPLMRASFVQCLFLSITRCFVVYDVNLSLTNGDPFGSSELAAMHVYNTAFTYRNYGVGQAEALILFIVCAIIGVTQVYVGKKGEVEA